MDQVSSEVYKEVNPLLKNAKWCDDSITLLRRDTRPIVDIIWAKLMKQKLFSKQSMERVVDAFKDKKFIKRTEFKPIGFLEALRNSMVEEITKNPPKSELRATDPAAISDRKKDITLLKSRKLIEGNISQAQGQIQLPPYKFDPKNYKGNVEEFDKMGLDENDTDDILFYSEELQRLKYEVAGQSVLLNVMKINRFDEDTARKMVNDILAVKTICAQSYVDKISGAIKYKYLYPETCYGIFGDSNDGKDDICHGWQDTVTIMEWLRLVGNEFDFERDWRKLLWAMNYCCGYKYTGFRRNGTAYDCCGNESWMKEGGFKGDEPSSMCDWTTAFSYKIYAGYIEWATPEATSTFLKNEHDPNFVDQISYTDQLEEKQIVEGYYKESNYQIQWYSSYYITTSSLSQWIYGFGKVQYQQLFGSNDEYSAGTLIYYREQGETAVEIAEPFMEIGNMAFYKMAWVIDKCKPEEDVYVYDELLQVAKGYQRKYPQMAGGKTPTLDNILTQAIQYQRENFVRIRAFPQIDGKTIGQLPPLEGKRNGIDNLAIALESVIQWVDAKIAEKIGWNPMRSGANPPPRESNKSEMAVVESSYNSTGYVYRMIQYLKERIATTTLSQAQDIVKYKDSIPYKWLLKLVGNEDFDALKSLDDFAPHRYGLFIRDYNTDFDKQRLIQAADMALGKGQITLDQWGLVAMVEDPKKGLKLLTLYTRKKAKKDRQQQQQDIQQQHQNKMQEIAAEKDVETTKGQILIQVATINAQATIQSAKIGSDGRIQVKEISVEAEGPKQAAKAEGGKELAATKENLKEQKGYPGGAGG